MAARPAQTWLSAHLHFLGEIYGEEGDRVITEVVDPFVARALDAQWITAYFFVRFRQNGGHIRLRLRGGARVLGRTVRRALLLHVQTVWPWPVSPDDAAAVVRWVPYTPELDRYGGDAAIAVAEACFESSSRLAFALTRKLESGVRPLRLGKALLAMLLLIHAFYPERVAAVRFSQVYGIRNLRAFAREEGAAVRWREAFDSGFESQASALRQVVASVWKSLSARAPLLGELDRFRRELALIRGQLESLSAAGSIWAHNAVAADAGQAFSWVVPSYVHMMNNRVGVSIPEEAYLAHLIARSLQVHANIRAARTA